MRAGGYGALDERPDLPTNEVLRLRVGPITDILSNSVRCQRHARGSRLSNGGVRFGDWAADVPPETTGRAWARAATLTAGHDGFSRIPAMLAFFPEGVDANTLLPEGDPLGSLEPTAPVQLRRVDTGEAHPVMAELDLNARSAAEQALIVRPHRALEPATTYVVAITDALGGPGGPLVPDAAFAAVLDGTPTDSPELEAMRPDLDAAIDSLQRAGVARDSLVLAWTFTTRSREQVTGPLLAMQQAMLDAPLPAPTINGDEQDGTRRILHPCSLSTGSSLKTQEKYVS